MVSPLKDKVDALEMGLSALAPKDRDFADSLINGKYGFKKSGLLSPKQVYWVDQLLAKVLGGYAKPAAQAADVGSFAGVYALFEKAKAKLKYPKIRLQVGNQPVCLAVAGPKSKYNGSVLITDGEKFGFNKYFGRVDKSGSFLASASQSEASSLIAGLLSELAKDPIKVARENGKFTGFCCFCNKSLSDEQSVAAGFGPVCAKNFGLWGAYKEAESILAENENEVDA